MAAEHGTGGALRIEMIGLAVLAPQPAVGAADLVDGVAAVAKGAGETGAIRAGAFDAKGFRAPLPRFRAGGSRAGRP